MSPAPLTTLRQRDRRDLAQVERLIPTLDRAYGDALRDPERRNLGPLERRWKRALEIRRTLKARLAR